MRSPGDRDPFKVVGQATRGAIAAALEANVPPSALRVLLATIHEMTTWSRLWDDVARSTLAARAGVSERQTTRAIDALVAAGAIDWDPGNRFRWSRISVSRHATSGTSECPTDPTDSGTSECLTDDDVSETSNASQRDIFDESAGHPGASSGTSECPTPEVPTETNDDYDPRLRQEWRRRVLDYESSSGKTAGKKLRDIIWQQVIDDEDLDRDFWDQVVPSERPRPDQFVAARNWALQYRGWSTDQFEEALAKQSDWQPFPELLDAARESYRSTKLKVY